MTNQYPITPPLVLLQQWWEQADQYQDDPKTYFDYVVTEVAQWAADQELEACRMEIIDGAGRVHIDETRERVRLADDIRAARRPKPPSLKQQALEFVDRIEKAEYIWAKSEFEILRRALEALPE